MNDEDYTKKYQKVINQLIDKSFPTLKNKKIEVFEHKKLGSTADVKRCLFFLRIRTHPRMRGYDKKKLIGIFAHELSHLEQFEKNKFDYYFIRCYRLIFKKYVKKEEAEADISTIKKGYTRQFHAQRKSRWHSKDKNAIKNKWKYLSPKQIKDIAIKLNKW